MARVCWPGYLRVRPRVAQRPPSNQGKPDRDRSLGSPPQLLGSGQRCPVFAAGRLHYRLGQRRPTFGHGGLGGVDRCEVEETEVSPVSGQVVLATVAGGSFAYA